MSRKKLFFLLSPVLLIVLATSVYAGSLSPSAPPAATSYTLDDIYTRLTTNGTATEAGHAFTPGGAPGSTLHTLKQLYQAIPTIDPSKLLSTATYLGVTGSIQTRTLSAATGTVLAGYYNATTLPSIDTDLAAGNIKNGTNVFGIVGSPNVVDTTAGTAGTGDILSGKTAWVAGAQVTGNVTAGSNVTGSNGLLTFTIPNGLYSGSKTATAADTNLAAGNIKNAVTIFGVTGNLTSYTYGDNSGAYVLGSATSPGTALKNLFNGTSGAFTGGSQANGGADDYNNGGAAAALRYKGQWTQCDSAAYNAVTHPGGNYCNSADSGADAKDNSTGLIWSLPCNGSGCTVLADASPYPATYGWDSSYRNNTSLTASQLCSGHSGWFFPHQKQLMQAEIDGSYGNLEASGVSRLYWSATTFSSSTPLAWAVNLSRGDTTTDTKTVAHYLRCVRSAS